MYKNIFLMRHGEAGNQPGQADFDRELTEKGIHEVKTAFQSFLNEKKIPGLFLVSPVLRAQMTYQVIKDEFRFDIPKYDCQSLVYTSHPTALFEEIKSWEQENLFLISHQPLIGDFIARYGLIRSQHISVPTASIHKMSFTFDDAKMKGNYLGTV